MNEIEQIRARLADHANGNGIQVGYGVGCGAVIADVAALLAALDQLRAVLTPGVLDASILTAVRLGNTPTRDALREARRLLHD